MLSCWKYLTLDSLFFLFSPDFSCRVKNPSHIISIVKTSRVVGGFDWQKKKSFPLFFVLALMSVDTRYHHSISNFKLGDDCWCLLMMKWVNPLICFDGSQITKLGLKLMMMWRFKLHKNLQKIFSIDEKSCWKYVDFKSFEGNETFANFSPLFYTCGPARRSQVGDKNYKNIDFYE